MNKDTIRAQIKDLINQYKSTFASQSQMICKKIIESEIYKAATEIYAYMPLPDEVDLIEVIKKAIQDGKNVALPKIMSKTDGIIEFFYLDSQKKIDQQTATGTFGILEPDEKLPAAPDATHNTLILVPGRAFTKDGDRLGRGKGYYDRYLGNRLLRCARNDGALPNITLAGVCFDFQIKKSLPVSRDDVKMDMIFS